MQMKILHVISSLAGGPARTLVGIAINGQPECRHVVVVFSDIVEDDLLSLLLSKAHEVHCFPRRGKLDFKPLLRLRRANRRICPDVVISYDFTSNVFGALCVLGRSQRWFPCVHGLVTGFEGWRNLVQRVLYLKAQAVIVPSCAVREKLMTHNVAGNDKVVVIPNGIDVDAPQRRVSAPQWRYKIVCVANFYSEVKGHRYAVEAMKLLPEEYTLTFIGDGQELEGVKDLVRRYSLDSQVDFRGAMNNHDMRKLLPEYDVMVVPSLSESFGIAAVEGMAAGLPVVASAVGGLPEVVVDDECGVLVQPGNSERLAKAIKSLCDEPATWERMHHAGLARARDFFSVGLMADRYYREFGTSHF